jgi:hypothetical protein
LRSRYGEIYIRSAMAIAHEGSGLLLGVTDEGVTPGTLTLQWGDNGAPDHLWVITPN